MNFGMSEARLSAEWLSYIAGDDTPFGAMRSMRALKCR
jgi:hypothetical protein